MRFRDNYIFCHYSKRVHSHVESSVGRTFCAIQQKDFELSAISTRSTNGCVFGAFCFLICSLYTLNPTIQVKGEVMRGRGLTLNLRWFWAFTSRFASFCVVYVLRIVMIESLFFLVSAERGGGASSWCHRTSPRGSIHHCTPAFECCCGLCRVEGCPGVGFV